MAAAEASSVALKALRPIARVATAPKQREGAGFIVRRAIGGALSAIDPFLMLDHFGPVTYAPGEAVGAPDHPHRGQETVTYMVEGEFEHRDSWGNKGTLKPEWTQWMTAGSGLVHSEMPSARIQREGGTVEGFQLWVNLPAKQKMVEPRYQDTPPEKMPVVPIAGAAEGSEVKVIAGEYEGHKSAIGTHTPIIFFRVSLAAPGDAFSFALPEDHSGAVYCFRGAGNVNEGGALVEGQVAELKAGEGGIRIEAGASTSKESRSSFLIIAGRPIGEPVAQYGPFVMNTREEIMDAIRDFQAGKFGRIEGERERAAQTAAARTAQKRSGRWERDSAEL